MAVLMSDRHIFRREGEMGCYCKYISVLYSNDMTFETLNNLLYLQMLCEVVLWLLMELKFKELNHKLQAFEHAKDKYVPEKACCFILQS